MAGTADTAQLVLSIDASTELLRKSLDNARQAFDGMATNAVASGKKVEQSLTSMGASSGNTRLQFLELTHVGRSLFDEVQAGVPITQALTVEFGRITQVVAEGGGLKSSLGSLVSLMGGPVAVGFEAAGAAVAGLIAWYALANRASVDLEGVEKTLATRQADLAHYFDATTGAINTQITATERLAKAQALAKDSKGFTENSTNAKTQLFRAADSGASPNQTAGSERGIPINVPFTDDSPSKAAIRTLTADLAAGKIGIDAYAQSLAGLGTKDSSVKKLTDQLVGLAAQSIQADRDLAKSQAQIALLNGTATEQQKTLLGIVEPGKSVSDIIARVSSENDKAAVATARYNVQIEKLKEAYNSGHGTISEPDFEAGVRGAEAEKQAVIDGIEAEKKAREEAEKAKRKATEQEKKDAAALATANREVANIKPEPSHFGDFVDSVNDELDKVQAQIDAHKLKVSFELQPIDTDQATKNLLRTFDQANKAEDRFATGLASTLSKGIFESGNLGDALVSALERSGEALIESGLLDLFEGRKGDNGVRTGGILDGLFNGSGSGFLGSLGHILGFADGGVPPAGKVSLVGEHGPELLIGDGRALVQPIMPKMPSILSPATAAQRIDVHVHTTSDVAPSPLFVHTVSAAVSAGVAKSADDRRKAQRPAIARGRG